VSVSPKWVEIPNGVEDGAVCQTSGDSPGALSRRGAYLKAGEKVRQPGARCFRRRSEPQKRNTYPRKKLSRVQFLRTMVPATPDWGIFGHAEEATLLLRDSEVSVGLRGSAPRRRTAFRFLYQPIGNAVPLSEFIKQRKGGTGVPPFAGHGPKTMTTHHNTHNHHITRTGALSLHQ
jgi:hypothetical protein